MRHRGRATQMTVRDRTRLDALLPTSIAALLHALVLARPRFQARFGLIIL